ncbi:MAG: flagellar hook-associated protein FlgK [Burkholderiaceae bacterium]|nr:flagellar hook-associated protein FlgK [Burkholderiaceae bacterium]
MGALEIGSSALRAAYAQLQTTGNNIANAATPGYSRQRVILAEAVTSFGGSGFMGRGVDVVTVERQYNDFLAREIHLATAAEASDSARAGALARLDRLFADGENGIGAAYNDLTAAMADLTNRPFDPAARSVLTQRANVLAQRIAMTDQRMGQIGADVDRSLGQQAVELNQLLAELAGVNDRIGSAHGSGHAPNELLDRRDYLIEEVNRLVKTNIHINHDQTVSLYAGTGDALVLGTKASRVEIANDPENPNVARLLLVAGDRSVPMNEAMLGGGSIAGLLEFRNRDLQESRWQLGQLAGAMAHAYNTQQSLGLDQNGTVGADVFRAGAVRSTGAGSNDGDASFTATITAGDQLRASDYELAYDGSTYQIKRLSDGAVSSFASLPIEIDGLEIALDDGAVAAGDRYTIRSASAFAGDFAMVLGDPAGWAAASPATPKLGVDNAGTLSVAGFGITTHDAATAAPVTITFTGPGTYSVSGAGTGDPTDIPYSPGDTVSFNGWSVTLNGTPAGGDTITISPPADVAGDNRNAAQLLGLADRGIVGGRTVTNGYGELVAGIGARAQAAEAGQRASVSWRESATTARDEVSGVNLDEEAARLIQFQQAYQAAAKVITTSQQMFEALINATN